MSSKINSIRATLKSKLSTDVEDKKRMQSACPTAVSGLEMTQYCKGSRRECRSSRIASRRRGVLFMLGVVKKSFQNAEDVEKLTQRIANLNTVLQNPSNRGSLSDAIICRIDQLAMKWRAVTDEVQNMASRHSVKCLIHYNDDVQAINGHFRAISWSIESFMVETISAIEFTLDETRDIAIRIEGKLDKLGESTESGLQVCLADRLHDLMHDLMPRRVNAKLDMKNGHPPHAIYAQFDCKERTRCLEGTRDGSESSGAGVEDAGSENYRIFWINASAGTGKMTIANTIPEVCRKRGILGASFFCSRDDAECSNPNPIFTTIAHQLGQFFPPFDVELAKVLKSYPDISYSIVPYQLEELIVQPLRAVGESFSSCVIVLDALEECKEIGATSITLSSLSRHVSELSPLKILVTNHPERKVTDGFKSSELNHALSDSFSMKLSQEPYTMTLQSRSGQAIFHGHQDQMYNLLYIYLPDYSYLQLRPLNLLTTGIIATQGDSWQIFYAIHQRSPQAHHLHITILINYIRKF